MKARAEAVEKTRIENTKVEKMKIEKTKIGEQESRESRRQNRGGKRPQKDEESYKINDGEPTRRTMKNMTKRPTTMKTT